MKLANLNMVNRISDARYALRFYIDAIATPGKLVVTIDGNRMDENISALVTPVVERELRARIAELDKDLKQLGVDAG